MIATKIGQGRDGEVYKITDGKKVYTYKIGNEEEMNAEKKLHFHIYDSIKCKSVIVKPIELTPEKEQEIKKITKKDRVKKRLSGYAMEYIDGITLRDYLRQLSLSATNYSSVKKQLQNGFKCLWSHGFIHGDAHMGNVMVTMTKTGKPKVKIFDFGFTIQCTAPTCKSDEELLKWFQIRWKRVLTYKYITKGNPDSMYLKLNMIPVFVNFNRKYLNLLNTKIFPSYYTLSSVKIKKKI